MFVVTDFQIIKKILIKLYELIYFNLYSPAASSIVNLETFLQL